MNSELTPKNTKTMPARDDDEGNAEKPAASKPSSAKSFLGNRLAKTQPDRSTDPVFRVDRFSVPIAGRQTFLEKVEDTHGLLRTLPGFKQDFILESASSSSTFNFITFVEWENVDAMQKAGPAVRALHEKMKFNPEELFEQFDIEVDRGDYKQIDIDTP